MILLTCLGLLLRLGLLPLSPRLGYVPDHDDFVRWGAQAVDDGVLTLYDAPPARRDIRVWRGDAARWQVSQRPLDRVFNYPPVSAYLLHVSGLLHRALDDTRLGNTIASRLSFALWSLLAELLVAWGCAAIVDRFRGRSAAIWTYAIVLFLPPLWWGSTLWGQVDSTVLAPAVWMLCFMLAGRWLAAGLCLGLALGLKQQAVLLVPLWALALVVIRARWRTAAGLSVAGLVLLVSSVPFLAHSGWAWWERSYWDRLLSPASEYARLTTLNAYNVWYADALLTDSRDATRSWLGVSRGWWSRGLVLAALLATGLAVFRRWRRDHRGLVLYAAVSLLCFMMLSTQIHERYLVMVLPFLAVSAVLWPRLRLPLVMLTLVAMAQLTWPQWLQMAPGGPEHLVPSIVERSGEAGGTPPHELATKLAAGDQQRLESAYEAGRARTRGLEWGLVLLALSATVMVARATVALRPAGEDEHPAPGSELVESSIGLLARVRQLGLPLLLVLATAYGLLGAHSSTDTWIALAAGRQILASPEFPLADTFSYTFAGSTWFNQNWLSGVLLWFAYHHFGGNGLVIVMFLLEAGIVALVLLTVWIRSRSWSAAMVAASLLAAACRDWLGFRAATLQFLLLAALLLALTALRLPGGRHRWWPTAVLGTVVLVWPHTHGSFVFGFGLVALFLGCALITRLTSGEGLGNGRLVALAVLLAAGVVLAAASSPFGIENLTHPVKVTGSDVFRQVSEWRPPTAGGGFPSVGWYWAVVGAAVASIGAAVGLRLASATSSDRAISVRKLDVGGLLFDAVCVATGLGLSLWARRFAPYLFILAAGPVVAATAWLARPQRPEVARRLRRMAQHGAWIGIAVLGPVTVFHAHRDLTARVRTPRGGDRYTLLERMVQLDDSPVVVLKFLRDNHLGCKLFTEWRLAGAAMFLAPDARVFIDGRSQQLYDERHYLTYGAIANAPPEASQAAVRALDSFRTDTVLLPRVPRFRVLADALDSSGLWAPVLVEPTGALFVRRGSDVFLELGRRERASDLRWPRLAAADAGRGVLLLLTDPPEADRAIELIRGAIEREPYLGDRYFPALTFAMIRQGRHAEALGYLERQREAFLDGSLRVTSHDRRAALEMLTRCEQVVRQQLEPPPP